MKKCGDMTKNRKYNMLRDAFYLYLPVNVITQEFRSTGCFTSPFYSTRTSCEDVLGKPQPLLQFRENC